MSEKILNRHPYTQEELDKIAIKLYGALKPKYPFIEQITLSPEPEERFKDNWNVVTLDMDINKRKKPIMDKHPELFDEYGWVKDNEAYDLLYEQLVEVKNSIRTVLKIIGYKTRDFEFDPHITY